MLLPGGRERSVKERFKKKKKKKKKIELCLRR